ncbi:MAG: M14 family zinc carboxypeptidase [Lacibacter sp.]
MKPLVKLSIFSSILLVFTFSVFAQEKYSTVRIYPVKDRVKMGKLLGDLVIDHFYEDGKGIVVEIGQPELKKLKASGFKYTVLVDDVYDEVRKQNKKYFEDRAAGRVAIEETNNTVANIITTPSAFVVQGTFGGYYSFAQMETAMTNLAATYPTIVTKTSLGTSIEGRDIWCIKISDNVATDDATEPDILYMGLQHAREAITGSSMLFFMQYLAEQYAAGNSKIVNLVNNREIYIIPCANPDGWEYNRTTAGGSLNAIGGDQRKNRRNVGSDATGQKGVDLNRNWGVDWGNCSAPILGTASSCGAGGVSNQSLETYYGASAFSEPETQAIRNLVMAAGKNFVAGFDQHAYGPYYSLPYGRRSLHTGGLPLADSLYLYNTSALMGQYNGMRANDSYGALGYEVAGGFKDWMLMGDIGTGSKIKAYGLTGEGAAGGGTGGSMGNFWAPAAQIINLCKGMCYQNLQLAFTAGSYVDLQDESDMAVTSTTGNFNFLVRRMGLANAPVTVTMIPLENISVVGTPVTIASLPNYNDTYSGSISYTLPGSIPNGQRVKFAWKVETGGQTFYDTITKMYNPVQLLFDNMDGTFATNWTNTTGTNWGFTSAGTGYGGTGKALSESPTGNYTTSSTRVVRYNSTFNLSDATAAYLNFWIKHRAENFRDKLQVQASSDGSTWTAIAGSTTIKEPGTLDGSTINGQPAFTGIRNNWTRQTFDLSAYLGQATVYIRFSFTSDADASSFTGELDDGFSIDNLKVIKSTSVLTTLPVEFVNFSGRLTNENTVELNWEAYTDQSHDHFEIEKSLNGNTFTNIGTYAGYPPFRFYDKLPVPGSNYYRIKQVDKDGHYTYSKIIEVIANRVAAKLTLYPNPAVDQLQVRFHAPQSDRYVIRFVNMQGTVVKEEQVQLTSGAAQLQLNVQSLRPQFYLVRIFNTQNELIGTERFLKQ